MSALTACHLGPTPYRDGLRLQEALVNARAEGRTGDWLLFPDHPPVLTVGRGASPGSLIADPAALAARGIERFEVTRGGDITWHGPGQLVGYCVCDLSRQDRDLHRFLRSLEGGLIDALEGFGIQSESVPGLTGVWTAGALEASASGPVGPTGGEAERKIASIGVHISRGVTTHGFAINVNNDLEPFEWIVPCGIESCQMTSLSRELGAEQDLYAFATTVRDRFGQIYGRVPVEMSAGELAERVHGVGALAGTPATLR